MGPVRRRHLIRGLAIVVSLNMVVALVALYAHAGDASGREARTRQATATSTSTSTSPGILAGGQFTKRRGTGTGGTGTGGTGTGSGTDANAGSGADGNAGSGSHGSAAGRGSATTGPAPETTGADGTPGPSGGAASGTATTITTPGGGTTAPGGSSGGTVGAAGTASGPGQPGALTDPAGDTLVDGTSDPIREGRADIVRAGAAYRPDALTFTLQVAQLDDPRADAKWAADSTYAVWSVDTDGDGKPDYDIQFSRDGGDLSGDVSQSGDSGVSVCDALSAGYGSDGYSVTVDPACLGNPPAVAFRATMYYDTNPKNDNSDVASDVAPDGGLSFPVSRPS